MQKTTQPVQFLLREDLTKANTIAAQIHKQTDISHFKLERKMGVSMTKPKTGLETTSHVNNIDRSQAESLELSLDADSAYFGMNIYIINIAWKH